jgi:hypothetical protein
VQEDVDGYTFCATDTERLAHLMLRVAADSALRERLGEASASLILDWGPGRFAAALMSAVRVCQEEGTRKRRTLDRLLLRGLARVRDGRSQPI